MNCVNNTVIVRRDVSESKHGAIEIPKEGQEIKFSGVVVACDPSITFLSPGAHVIFNKFAGVEHRIKDEDLLILHAKDILCTSPTSSARKG